MPLARYGAPAPGAAGAAPADSYDVRIERSALFTIEAARRRLASLRVRSVAAAVPVPPPGAADDPATPPATWGTPARAAATPAAGPVGLHRLAGMINLSCAIQLRAAGALVSRERAPFLGALTYNT